MPGQVAEIGGAAVGIRHNLRRYLRRSGSSGGDMRLAVHSERIRPSSASHGAGALSWHLAFPQLTRAQTELP